MLLALFSMLFGSRVLVPNVKYLVTAQARTRTVAAPARVRTVVA